MTGWSATTELFDAKAALHIPFQLISGGPYEYDRDSNGLMAQPDVKRLAAAMQNLRENTDLRHRLQRKSMNIAAQYTWDKAGAQLLEYCHELEKRPPNAPS
jgi:glycosyltransferase involved in cell wall biosynthesis